MRFVALLLFGLTSGSAFPQAPPSPRRDPLAEAFDGSSTRPPRTGAREDMDRAFSGVDIARSRNMAESTLGAVESLAAEALRTLDKVERLKREAAELRAKVADLERTRDERLPEIREGLFCSGCGHTRSEILARGESFPHPGQHVVRPTPEAFAAKVAELQRPIDQAREALRGREKDLAQARDLLEEILDQLQCGVRFWCTAATCESALIQSDGDARLSTLEASRRAAEEEVRRLRLSSPRRAAGAEGKLRTAEQRSAAAERALRQERQALQGRLAVAARIRRAESERLDRALDRGRLPSVLQLSGDFRPMSPTASQGELGGDFHMGALSGRLGGGAPVASVEHLIHTFRSTGSSLRQLGS